MSLADAFEAVLAARFAERPWPEDVLRRIYTELLDELVVTAGKLGASPEQAEALARRGLRIVHAWEIDEDLSPEAAGEMAREWLEEQLQS